MRIAMFSTRPHDRTSFTEAIDALGSQHTVKFVEARLDAGSAAQAAECEAACLFVHDQADAAALAALHRAGVRLVALRCTGFDHVDLAAAARLRLTVVRVPDYAPHAVAEHAVALMLALDRHIQHAWQRTRNQDFRLQGLMGNGLHGRTVGIVGTGRIGTATATILRGFGCHVVANDLQHEPLCEAIGVRYTSLHELLQESDIVSLHCALTPRTHHLIDHEALTHLRHGAMLVNTSRGAVVDTNAVILALLEGQLGSFATDVFEREAQMFHSDLSRQVLRDATLARLLGMPNVIVTPHQGFFTRPAVQTIARTTLQNATAFESGRMERGNLVVGPAESVSLSA